MSSAARRPWRQDGISLRKPFEKAAGLAPALAMLLMAACPEAPPPPDPLPSFEEKLARVMKLEDERSLGAGELAGWLADPEAPVRARAALALGRIGGAEAPLLLASLFQDPSAYVRATAALALGLLELDLPEDALAALRAALADEDPRVHGRAAEALAIQGGAEDAEVIGTAVSRWVPKGAEPYPWTEPITSTSPELPHPDVRLGLFALAKLESLRWAWDALATEGGTPRFDWWPAAWTASALSGEELLPVHLYYAGSPDPTLRLYGARGLGRADPTSALEPLRRLLFDPNEQVRIEAVRAAASLSAVALVPDLLTHLEADTRYVQVEILKALAVLPTGSAVEPLVDRLGDESPWIRSLALEALARQDEESFWLLLAGIGPDPDWEVRRTIAELMGAMGGERPRALLRELAEDPDFRVRAAALRALAGVDPRGSAGILIAHLQGDDPFERVAAAQSLARIQGEDAFAPIAQAFHTEREKDPRIRSALLRALAELDPDAVEPIARQSLDDGAHLLRVTAASILSRFGPPEAPVRGRSSERGMEDYLAILQAPFTPQAFLRTGRGVFEVELFIADAPLTVTHFIRLARDGYFEGHGFYEVVPNGYVATGDPRGDGRGGPGYTIRSERNGRHVLRGTLLMMEEEKDTGGSRFLITHLPAPELEGRATVFGHVTRGMEVVDRLEPSDRLEEVTIWDGVTSPYPP